MDRKQLIEKIAEGWKAMAADNSGMTDKEFIQFMVDCFYDTLEKEGIE